MRSLCVHDYRSVIILRIQHAHTCSNTQILGREMPAVVVCTIHKWKISSTYPPNHHLMHMQTLKHSRVDASLRVTYEVNLAVNQVQPTHTHTHTHTCSHLCLPLSLLDFLSQCDSISSPGLPSLMLWVVQTGSYTTQHASERREPRQPSYLQRASYPGHLWPGLFAALQTMRGELKEARGRYIERLALGREEKIRC